MKLKEAIYKRRSVREFTFREVDEKAIRKLIDAAIQAPSAVNEQPCCFTVIRDRTLLSGISDHAKTFMLQSPPVGLASHHLQELISDPAFNIFYNAPVLIVIASATNGHWAIENCTLAAENLMLAACAEGLGTCWIGFAQGWLDTPEGKAALQLPPEYKVVAPIIVGYPKAEPAPVPRKEPSIHILG